MTAIRRAAVRPLLVAAALLSAACATVRTPAARNVYAAASPEAAARCVRPPEPMSQSNGGRWVARLAPDPLGGTRVELVRPGSDVVMRGFSANLTNLLWLPDERGLLYATAGSGEQAGIWFYDPGTNAHRRVITPAEVGGAPMDARMYVCSLEAGALGGTATLSYLQLPLSADITQLPPETPVTIAVLEY